ncbi:MAG: hypothetical protein OQL08_10110 [Gammaproteobacteria bacterium]|nr:hypothetical protein [Gammaproteobacteria bacterium]
MVVWKGWGILALIIPLVISLATGSTLGSYYGENFYKDSTWAMPLVLCVSSVIVFMVGYKINSKLGKIVIDPENNEQIELKTTHSMFWIPLQYWSLIILAMAIWMYVANIGLIYKG